MALTTDSNYAGKAAGFYISAALRQATSLEYLTMIENIKFKSNIQKMDATNMVKDATCDFTGAGTLAMNETILTPEEPTSKYRFMQVHTFRFMGSVTNESRSRRTTTCIF